MGIISHIKAAGAKSKYNDIPLKDNLTHVRIVVGLFFLVQKKMSYNMRTEKL